MCPGGGFVPPAAANPHLRFVDVPTVTDRAPAGPSRLGQQRRTPLYPPVDRDVVDLDTALDQRSSSCTSR